MKGRGERERGHVLIHIFLFFPNIEKSPHPHPVKLTLALIAIPRPTAGMVERTGGYNFSMKGKQKALFNLVKPGAQLSIVILLEY